MSRNRFLLALVFGLAVAGSFTLARGAFYFDIWPASADGDFNMHSSEGYAINGDGNYRFTKSYHHMTFMAFNMPSDGPNKIQHQAPGDNPEDGVLLVDWLVGKKAFGASLYFRNSTNQTCDPFAAVATYWNDPVTVVGFRCSNVGLMVDRGSGGNGFTGCCAGYDNALFEGGENGPPAWRMGAPAATAPKYSQKGAIGPGGEFWMMSALDSKWAGLEVKVLAGTGSGSTNLPGSLFYNDGLGFEGWSDHANRFAMGWMVVNSDAHLINSGTIGTADCSGSTGGEEPRDRAQDLIYGEGWFAKHIDRCIISGLATDPEMKGLVFQSVAAATGLNTSVFSRDQSGGLYGPYLAIYATYEADCDNDGCVDVVDLLTMAGTWGLDKATPGFDPESDLNCDGWIDVVDLLTLAAQFGQVDCLNQ